MLSQTGRRVVCAAILIALVALTACSSTLPLREPDIRGIITSVTRSGNSGAIRIEGVPGGTGDDKASVAIISGTMLFRTVDGASPEPITLDDVTEGMKADAWFMGPTAESYPVQTTGGTILVSE
ncbi:MAG: hypothetical protein U1F44_04055 [Coriobacteriia bacterium]|nr:hypothetical protein [Coriobacteriia bacterium]